MFAAHDTVASDQVIMDRETGRSKGFGFVEMGSDQEAQNAIKGLNGQQCPLPPTRSVTQSQPENDVVGETPQSVNAQKRGTAVALQAG